MSTQIECGVLKRKVMGERIVFEGAISLSDVLKGKLLLTPHPRANPENENSPSYEIQFTPDKTKRPFLAGAAWIKDMKKEGEEFLSMTLDAVSWDRPINLAAFPPGADAKPEEKNDWRVVWSRPRGARVQDQFNEDQPEFA